MSKRYRVDVENVPDYAAENRYIVARHDPETDKFWFFGAWDDYDEAIYVAVNLGGFVFEREGINEEHQS